MGWPALSGHGVNASAQLVVVFSTRGPGSHFLVNAVASSVARNVLRWTRQGTRGLIMAGLALWLSGCGSLGSHRVQTGETLYSISFDYGWDYRQLAEWNQLKPPYMIYEGQILRVAPSVGAAVVESREPIAAIASSPPSLTARPLSSPLPPPVQLKPLPDPNLPIQWRWPTEGRLVQNFSGGSKGIDIAGKIGQAVRAAAGGRVVYAGGGMLHYGNLIIIKHNDALLSAYAHNRRLRVREGAEVTAGQQIADMGQKTDGDTVLHFQIRQDGRPVDPLRYLPVLR